VVGIENHLQHYGVKGMHWGQRKSADEPSAPTSVELKAKPGGLVKATGGKNHPAHEDALRVAEARQKARKSSTDALSNKELQDLVTRMNMEQQYNRLVKTDPRAASDFSKFMKQTKMAGKTIQQVNAFLKTPAGKAAKALVKAKLAS
jgi:hypothetical protein